MSNTTTTATLSFWRLKTEGFVCVSDEFPTVPSTWTPTSDEAEAKEHVNASNVSLNEVPACVWVSSPNMTRGEFRAYVGLLECESYEDAGDVWDTYNELKTQFKWGADEDASGGDEVSETETEVAESEPETQRVEPDAETAVAAAETTPVEVKQEVKQEVTAAADDNDEEVVFVGSKRGRQEDRDDEVVFVKKQARCCVEIE